MTIGQFYNHLDNFLATLPDLGVVQGRNQIDDRQFLQGELFAVNGYDDAHRAIQRIVSEGEGTKESPLDFRGEVAHYYRFAEIFYDQVLTKADNPKGYVWRGTLGVDWSAVYPAIADPGSHDFSKDPPAARAAQDRCDAAFTRLVQELQRAVAGEGGRIGNAVGHVRSAHGGEAGADRPLAVPTQVAGPSFRYRPDLTGGLRNECSRDAAPDFSRAGDLGSDRHQQSPPQYDETDSKTVFDSSAPDVARVPQEWRSHAVVNGGNWNPHGTHRSTFYGTTIAASTPAAARAPTTPS